MIAEGCADKDEQKVQSHPFRLYSTNMQLHNTPRYIRHHNYAITPLPESSEDEDPHYQNTTFDSRVCVTNEVEPSIVPVKRRIFRKLHRSSSKPSKNKLTVEMEWDQSLRPQASPQCRAVNLQIKRQTYVQMQSALGRCQLGDTRVIVLQGEAQTGKKTLIDSVLASQCIKNYYLDFSNSSLPLKKKVKQLCQFMADFHSQNTLQGLTQQNTSSRAEKATLTAIVINSYTSFLATLRRREERRELKKLLRNSRNVILIGVSCDIGRKPCRFLSELTYTIKMAPNTKEYFLESLLSAVQSSPLLTQEWLLARPLANFFSSKMEQAAQLSLQTIARLLNFLKAQPPLDNHQPQRITRDTLLKFEETIGRHSMRVDLQRLSIHEKCLLVACYTELQESSAVLVEEKPLIKAYEWVCSSLQITPKTKKEVRADLLYQLETYQLVRTYTTRSHSKDTLLAVDLSSIRTAYGNDFLLAKFFP